MADNTSSMSFPNTGSWDPERWPARMRTAGHELTMFGAATPSFGRLKHPDNGHTRSGAVSAITVARKTEQDRSQKADFGTSGRQSMEERLKTR
jgi:hypothetical protein